MAADKKKSADSVRVERVNDADERKKALTAALSYIEKEFGKGSIMRMSDANRSEDVEVVSTGSLGLDLALGVGGLPRGRVIEIFGPESSGKTTLTLHVIAEMQKIGGTCAFIDAEHALDVSYAQRLGVNLDELLLSQPDTGEQALEITDALVRSGSVDLIVIDSVAALTPKSEIEGEMGEALPGLQARLMSQALRKLTASITKTKTLVVFINQIRMKIGVSYGNPEVTTGGNALKFYSSVRIDIRRKGALKKGDDVYGAETRVKVVKNKVAPPFKETVFDILYGDGISREGELLDIGAELDVVDKSGAWYGYEGTRIGQGKDNAREYLKQHPETALEIENKIRALKGMKNRPTSLTPGEAVPLPEPKPAKAAKKAKAPVDDIDDTVIEPDELFD
ncbi:MAG: recombinase RecA [Sutterellaceae bacterium]|nr:recombinase RecA [Sutterellaceae bacterium]